MLAVFRPVRFAAGKKFSCRRLGMFFAGISGFCGEEEDVAGLGWFENSATRKEDQAANRYRTPRTLLNASLSATEEAGIFAPWCCPW